MGAKDLEGDDNFDVDAYLKWRENGGEKDGEEGAEEGEMDDEGGEDEEFDPDA